MFPHVALNKTDRDTHSSTNLYVIVNNS